MSTAWWPTLALVVVIAAGCGGSGASGAPGTNGLKQDAGSTDTSDAGGDPTDGAGGSGNADGVGVDAGPSGDGTGADTGIDDAGLTDVGGGDDVGLTDGGGDDGTGGDDTGGDADDGSDGDGGDVGQPDIEEEDTEEPGSCETDDECQFLTDKSCCPVEQDPCGGEPAVGNQSDQDEIIGWIAQTCDPVDTCDPIDPPLCDLCYPLEALTPVCDQEEKKCTTAKSLDCDALCAAMADPSVGSCPIVSDPTLMTPDNADDCGCPP